MASSATVALPEPVERPISADRRILADPPRPAAWLPALARRQRLDERLARPAAACLAAAVFALSWVLSGVAPADVARYAGFELAYSLIPGCLLYVLLSPRPGGWLRTIAIGWPCGYALELGAFALTAALHVRGAFAFWPLAATALLGPPLYRRAWRHIACARTHAHARAERRNGDAPRRRRAGLESLVVASGVAVAVLVVSFTFFAASPLPERARSVVYSTDSLFDVSLAADARHHWPIAEPWVAGEPIHYYTAAFVHTAAINQVTGIALSTVVLRLFPTMMFLVAALQLWSLGRALDARRSGTARWSGPVAVALLLAAGDLNFDPTHVEVFRVDPFNQFVLSPTFAFGAPMFLGLLCVMQSRILEPAPDARPSTGSAPDAPPPSGSAPNAPLSTGSAPDAAPPTRRTGLSTDARLALALVFLLVLACGVTKAFAMVTFLGGLGLFWLWCALTRKATRAVTWSLALSAAAAVAVYFLTLAGGTASTMTLHPFDFVTSGQTLAHVTATLKSHLGRSPLWVLALAAAVPVGVVVLLAPLAGALWLLAKRTRLSPFPLYLVATFALGMGAYVLIGAPGGVEGVFLVYGYIALLPVAASGLVKLWEDVPERPRRALLKDCAGVLALALAAGFLLSFLAPTGGTRELLYALCYGLVALAALAAVARNARLLAPAATSRAGRVLACAIPVVLALALVKPVALIAAGGWKTARHEQLAAPDSPANYGLTAALYSGLTWVRGHTDSCAVLAVNNHYAGPRGSLPVYFYYSAFAERRVFLESWYDTPRGTEVAQPYPARYKLNTEAVAEGRPGALRALAANGVDYVLLDKVHGGGAPEPASVSRRVFDNGALTVYRLLAARGC